MSIDPTVLTQADCTGATITPIDESCIAYRIFQAFVEGYKISLTDEELLEYAVKDLNVNLSILPNEMVESLPIILVAFMNMWSGWHFFKNEYKPSKMMKDHYFSSFMKYMTDTMKAIVPIKGLNNACSELAYSNCKSAIKSTGSPLQITGEFFPYSISIACPPHMLNTIVFSNCGDDVIMKQHLGSTWCELSTSQLVNWPYVEVSFRTPDIHFVRKQATDFMRYLNFLPDECFQNSEVVVEHAETLHSCTNKKKCYSLPLLKAYINEYLRALKSIREIKEEKLEEIQVILTQFLEDVKIINVNNSMATNVSVLFRLSPRPFFRKKQLVKNTDKDLEARVDYCEIITPKIELVMMYFKAIQNHSTNISFEFTDKILKKAQEKLSDADLNIVMPYIKYKCTFCKVEYHTENAKNMIMEHLRNQHEMEQYVGCTTCKKQFDVLKLAECCWRHRCEPAEPAAPGKDGCEMVCA